MARYWALALLALIPLTVTVAQGGGKVEKDVKIDGKLTNNDPIDKRRGGASQTHVVPLKAGKTYTIDMKSTAFDSYLFLDDANNNQLAEDDDSGGNLDAQIVFNCTKDGNYKVVCTTFGAGAYGNYTLTVKGAGMNQPMNTPHQLLMGKAASEFVADAAITGKTIRMSSLKGKVVLLAFLDARLPACTGTFPQLSEWHKTHKGAGLEIIALSFYPSDIGQRIGFDKDAGKLTSAETGDRKSDLTAFKALAAHHKLEFRWLALSKDEALQTFQDYGVNGLPQFVVVDRQGMVRTIFAGEKNVSGLESAIKKTLEEK